MTPKSFEVRIHGYWREEYKSDIPNYPGLFFVYKAKYNREHTLSIHELIYIGEAHDVRKGIENHAEYVAWRKYTGAEHELCFSTAYVEEENRERIAAAYIYAHKPSQNPESKHSFPFEDTVIFSSGSFAFLSVGFAVTGTRQRLENGKSSKDDQGARMRGSK